MPKSESPTGTPVVLLRNSERSTYRRCRQKWWWSYHLRLSPPREKGALTFGTLIHECLAGYYPPGVKRGVHPARTFDTIWNDGKYDFSQWDEEGNKINAYDLGMAMCEGYVDLYGVDEDVEIIQPEMSMEVDVFDKQGRYLCTWVGQGDAMYRKRSTKRVGFVEHKTAKSIEEELNVISGYGEQGLSYFWAGNIVARHLGIISDQESLDHVLYNWLKKGLPDDRPKNEAGESLNKPSKDALLTACAEASIEVPKKVLVDDLHALLLAEGIDPLQFGEVSKVQKGPLFHRFELPFGEGELENINWRIRAEAWEMSQVRAGKLPILKSPTKDCKWECQFRDACELHSMGGDYQDMFDLEFTTWDPYSNHELVEEKGR